MDLQQEIDKRRAEIRSDDYVMSIGEWISLYEKDEIDIHPEFQRFFRWSRWQKSCFIESVLLGIPIPPVFVWQRENGVWEIIEGFQRLSTIFEFVGILKDEDGNLTPPLVLEGTQYLPSLEGKVWDSKNLAGRQKLKAKRASSSEDETDPRSFTPVQKFLMRRAKIPVNIILRENDERNKYFLFQRLNSSGSNFSEQELRNCILVSINRDAYVWLKTLAVDENFKNCVNLTDRATIEGYDLELVLRFLTFRHLEASKLRNISDIDDFLTKSIYDIAQKESIDMDREGKYFKQVFEILSIAAKEHSFRRYDATKNQFIGGFLISAFDAISLGIGYNIEQIIDRGGINIEEQIKKLWKNQEFTSITRSNLHAPSSQIWKTISLGRRFFKP